MANVGKGPSGYTLNGRDNGSPGFQQLGTNANLTQYGLVVAQGNDPFTVTSAATDGQVMIGATGAEPDFGTITSSDGSLLFSAGANSLSITVAGGSTVGKTITGDSGGALSPTSGNWNIVSTATNGIDTSGSGSTLTVAMATPYADGDFEFRSATSGQTRQLLISNTSDTADSQAKITTSIAGTSAGDTWIEHVLGSTIAYATGIDNSDSDKLKFTYAAAATANPSTANPVWEFTGGTGFNYANTTSSLGIGIGVDPTTLYPLHINKSADTLIGLQINNPSTGTAAHAGISFLVHDTATASSIRAFPDNSTVNAVFRERLVFQSDGETAANSGFVLNHGIAGGTYFVEDSATVENARITSAGISFDGGTNSLGTYTQGSWTPTLTGSTVPPDTITYTSQVGRYTRIGNTVTCHCTVVVNAFTLGSGSGQLRLQGFPFTAANVTNLTPMCPVQMQGIAFDASAAYVVGQMQLNSMSLAFIEVFTNAAVQVTSLSDLAAGDSIRLTITYQV